jgi:sulfatase modifying factor 1
MSEVFYQIALSFAGEDRQQASDLATALTRRGITVYLDQDPWEEARMLGRDLYAFLTDLYQKRAQYVVIFVSRHYAAKEWTKHEYRAAQAGASDREAPYILPIRLDDSSLEGLSPTVAFLRWDLKGPENIADLLARKLGVVINRVDDARLLLVPEGHFVMGSDRLDDDQKPSRSVYMDAFYVYETPVTVAQYERFCAETHRAKMPQHGLRCAPDDPVVNVSWDDATSYAAWTGVQLPTEAQWEKAARGTDGRSFPWGNEWDEGRCEWRRFEWSPQGGPISVKSHPNGASPYGALGMIGNIWEWCADWYGPTYYKRAPARNPKGPAKGTRKVKVTRGCAHADDGERFPWNFSCSYRDHQEPGFYYRLHGFRCVASIDFGLLGQASDRGDDWGRERVTPR